MSQGYSESSAEQAARAWLEYVGYRTLAGVAAASERLVGGDTNYSLVVLPERLHRSLMRLNASFDPAAIEQAEKKLVLLEGATMLERNRTFQRYLAEGVPVEIKGPDGHPRTVNARIIDASNPNANDLVAVSQFLVKDKATGKVDKPDIVVFINGMPLAVIELKDPGDEKTSWWTAYRQIQRYKAEIPSLFEYNALCIASDGMFARVGSLTADESRFAPWRTIDGTKINPKGLPELETMIRGLLSPAVLLDFVQGYIFFEELRLTDKQGRTSRVVVKKIAGYHQYHAVKKAVLAIVDAVNQTAPPRRGGVVWHTQGSGKSITMLMLAGQLIAHPVMKTPTIVVVTDRTDLDDQLFKQFAGGRELLNTVPIKAESRSQLADLLNTTMGGVIFTTVQKFDESQNKISERPNIVVLADEAHRTQYGFVDGFAAKLKDALPNAIKVGFTGTPVAFDDRNTRGIFGDYIDVYDMTRAVDDDATVRILYQNRTVPLSLAPGADYEEMYKNALAAIGMNAERARGKVELDDLVGADARLKKVAAIIVEHFQQREKALHGKAMIVCMSRLIAAKLYEEIIALRPKWYNADEKKRFIDVAITGVKGEANPIGKHIRTDGQREELAERFKDPGTDLRIAIVCDMWLTGFDVPCLHTLYLDKPLAGHTLMQAIARVNRVFGTKPAGLVVDLLGIAPGLKAALAEYAQYDPNRGAIMPDQASIVPIMQEKYGLATQFFHGADYSGFFGGDAVAQQRAVKLGADHVLTLLHGKRRFLDILASLSKAFAMAVPLPETDAVVKDLGYFQAVGAVLRKTDDDRDDRSRSNQEDDSAAVRQVIAGAVVSGEVIDLFAASGIKDATLDVFDEKYLAELAAMPQRNLAIEVLRKLLTDKIRSMQRTSLVKSRQFGQALEEARNKYKLRPLEVAQVLQELMAIAGQIKAEPSRADAMKLNPLELAFYDALAQAKDVEELVKDGTLKALAQELTDRIRSRAGIDWTMKDSLRAEMRAIVKRLLRKYKYPPQAQDKATEVVMEQAERMAEALSTDVGT